MLVPVAGSSSFINVTSVATNHTAMTGKRYIFTADTDCFIKQAPAASSPVASAASGSMLVPSGLPVLIDPLYGDTLSVIRNSADGVSTLQELALVG